MIEDVLETLHQLGWENILEGYNNYPVNFQRFVPFMLASIIYHMDNLRHLLPDRHPIWNQRIFSARMPNGNILIAEYLRGRALTGHRYCELSRMHATGIPSHLAVAHQVDRLREDVNNFRTHLMDAITEFRDENNAAHENLPNRLKDSMLENFVVNGVMPLTVQNFQNSLGELKDDILIRFNERINDLMRNNNNINIPNNNDQHLNNNNDNDEQQQQQQENGHENLRGCKYFIWGGKMGRLVPRNYEFPSTNTKSAWNMWHYGHPIDIDNHTYPLKRALDDRHKSDFVGPKNKCNISKTAKVMQALFAVAVQLQLVNNDTNITNLTRQDGDQIFNSAFDLMCNNIYRVAPKRRQETICITIADKLYKRLRRENNDNNRRNNAEGAINEHENDGEQKQEN